MMMNSIGQVVWRHVFESASAGNIQLLHVGEKVTTVTGSNPYLVRGWDTATGKKSFFFFINLLQQ